MNKVIIRTSDLRLTFNISFAYLFIQRANALQFTSMFIPLTFALPGCDIDTEGASPQVMQFFNRLYKTKLNYVGQRATAFLSHADHPNPRGVVVTLASNLVLHMV